MSLKEGHKEHLHCFDGEDFLGRAQLGNRRVYV